MRHYLIPVALIFTVSSAIAQTNVFPSSGNVGIGTLNPTAKISFNSLSDDSNNPDGITWYTPNPLVYGIYRTAGPWNAPNYQQLRLAWDTGIILDPGSLYGKSYVEIQGAGLRVMSGNVGIGNINPRERLDIGGKAIIQNTLQTNDYMYTGQHHGQLRILSGLGVYGSKALEFALMDNGTAVIQSNEAGVGYNALVLNPVLGDVGIGTIDPKGYKLAVNGKIRAHEIKVESTNWPDYVFTKSYQLPTLQEIEKYIKEKGHLTGIPSAAEVKANGIDLGEMNAKLLQKIEELTLHLIEKDKNEQKQKLLFKDQNKIIEKLIERLESLEKGCK